MTRRQLLGYGSLSFGVTALAPLGAMNLLGVASRGRPTEPVLVAGTTLESTVVQHAGVGYRRLRVGAPRRAVLRDDLADPGGSREDGRIPLATVVQLTDLHITDAQHPLRFEYADPWCRTAYRPQELLGTHGAAAMVRRVNELKGGPFTGRPVDVVVSTGDGTDNQCGLELDWLLTVLAGGTVWPSSGDPDTYEGVASCEQPQFWQPEGESRDGYRAYGFPEVTGLLAAATKPFRSPGLDPPWVLTMGNHDNSALGTLPLQPELVELATGNRKVFAADQGKAAVLGERLAASTLDEGPRLDAHAVRRLLDELTRGSGSRTVTPDPRRAPFTAEDYLRALGERRYLGSGPHGHGYAEETDPSQLYFTHRISDRVVAVSLDTTNQAGGASGSLGTGQLRWLDRVLQRHSEDYVVVLSHHPSTSLVNLAPDPRAPHERRHAAAALLATLHRHPNVVAWVNGHLHRNRITAHRHTDPRRSFWEIGTASHVDAPQQSRVLELARNNGGTVSIFTTLLDALSPLHADPTDLSPAGLASYYRELAFNDRPVRKRAGDLDDGNAELLLTDPFARADRATLEL